MISNIDQTGGGNGGARRAAATDEDDFKKIVDLLAEHSTAQNELEQLESSANGDYLLIVDALKPKYARIQRRFIEAETALELLARKHPEWFTDKKTIKTPYGSVQLKNNPPKLVAENPELSIVLIERDGEMIPKTINDEPNPAAVDASKLIRQEKSLNLEALAGCTDAQLKRWRITREQSDTFTVKSAKLDMGKAVKEAATKEAQKSKD